MLHYSNRMSRIHILTLDRNLATDVYERLHNWPGMESVELIRPGSGESDITVADIARLTRETTTSRVLVIDARRQTKGRLQGVHSDIVRFNRPDFNLHCYSVLIGDGPVGLLDPGKHAEVLGPFLSDLRVDYTPAAFFTNPFLHYSYDEIQYQMVYENCALPTRVPHRLEKYLKKHDLTVEQLARYGRAADVPPEIRDRKRAYRTAKFKALCLRILTDEFPEHSEQLANALTREGYGLMGESLRVNIYPFFFEERVLDLMKKAALPQNGEDHHGE